MAMVNPTLSEGRLHRARGHILESLNGPLALTVSMSRPDHRFRYNLASYIQRIVLSHRLVCGRSQDLVSRYTITQKLYHSLEERLRKLCDKIHGDVVPLPFGIKLIVKPRLELLMVVLVLSALCNRFDLIQTFHACKQEEGKPVAAYVRKIKGYVEQLEHLGYVLPQDLSVGLILKGLTSDFAGFVRNYNMHNMGKTIGELYAMLIEYEKGLTKKAETPQVMVIRGGKIQKANKKSLKAKGKGKANGKGKDKQVYIPKPKNPKPSAKEHPAKDDICHHCKEVGHWKRNFHVYRI
ncbi:retrotransposon protein, putative, ty1-copia subclass [Tanacetum coccineum]